MIVKQSMCALCAIGLLSATAGFVAAKAGGIETVVVTAQFPPSLHKKGNKVTGGKRSIQAVPIAVNAKANKTAVGKTGTK